MKKLLPSLSLALLAALAVLPFTAGTFEASQPAPVNEQFVSVATDGENLCGKCGDGYCSKTCGETATSCPRDCGVAY